MKIATRVVRDDGMSAVKTLIAMSAQGSGAARRDGQQHLFVVSADPPPTALNEGRSGTANDVGHLQRRPLHALCVCWCAPRIPNASRGLEVARR